MNFENFLKKEAKVIDRHLEKELGFFKKSLKDQVLTLLFDKFISSCQGGKRIRGVLVLLGYEIARAKGQGERGEVHKAAVAVEIFQTAILAHDDIIDQSATRRDKPSLYKSAGTNQALILADIGFFLSNALIDNPKAQKFFIKAMINTALGELLDIQPKLSETQRIKMYKLKTAWYTFIAPLSLGAILAGAGEKLLRDLQSFGENLGIAYQFRDDILDKDTFEQSDTSQKKVLKYSLAAKEKIGEMDINEQSRKLLEEMVEYLVRRTK